MLKRLMLWLRIDPPPKQYYRCGTMYLRASPEGKARIAQRWREEDEQFVTWVETHPRPKQEWLDQVRRIRSLGH